MRPVSFSYASLLSGCFHYLHCALFLVCLVPFNFSSSLIFVSCYSGLILLSIPFSSPTLSLILHLLSAPPLLCHSSLFFALPLPFFPTHCSRHLLIFVPSFTPWHLSTIPLSPPPLPSRSVSLRLLSFLILRHLVLDVKAPPTSPPHRSN